MLTVCRNIFRGSAPLGAYSSAFPLHPRVFARASAHSARTYLRDKHRLDVTRGCVRSDVQKLQQRTRMKNAASPPRAFGADIRLRAAHLRTLAQGAQRFRHLASGAGTALRTLCALARRISRAPVTAGVLYVNG